MIVAPNLVGQVFGRWKVLQRNGLSRTGRVALWTCVCQCGTIKTVRADSLRRGNSKSCGCLVVDTNIQLNTLPPGEAERRAKLATYKRSAEERNLSWTVSDGDFYSLIERPCFYCGDAPLSGIDRIDNQKGYDLNNCRSCCKDCNYAKNVMSETHFLAWVEKVYLYTRPVEVLYATN